MASPAVSVIIPTYNRLAFLKQTISSVLNQTFADLELIVVDDGSTDGTLAYLSTTADPRVRPIELPHTGNIARVRNAGARAAAGRFLCFIDSDDLWLPRKLAVQMEQTAASGVQWSYTRYDHVDEEGRPLAARAGQWRALSGDIALQLITTEASVALCTVLLERKLFQQLSGFDEDPGLVLREDYEFTVRLALAANTHAVAQSLARVRDHAGRSTYAWTGAAPFATTAYAYAKLLGMLTDKNLRRAARRRRAYHLAEAGARYLRARSFLSAGRCFLRSALDGPLPRQWVSALLRGVGVKA